MNPTLTVELRPLQASDSERVLSWRNHPQVREAMFHHSPIAPEEHARWLERACARENGHYFLGWHQDRPVGFLGLTDINSQHQRASWTFYKAPECILKGAGQALCRAGMAYGFTELGLHKLWAEVLAFNTASLALHRALGFAEEGLQRDHYRRDGVFYPIHLFGICASTWRQHSPGSL